MKKLFIVLLISLLVTALLAACSSGNVSETGAGESTARVTTALAEPTVTTTAATTVQTTAAETTAAETTAPSPDLSGAELDTYIDTSVKMYTNPLTPNYGIADPFCMRYDGEYYLYCTAGENADTLCYRSKDLVNWSTPVSALAAAERATQPNGKHSATYAPEVTYFNGKFYMVTALPDIGHYVFVSDLPTGPFKCASENLKSSIDGHIFIDNDGKWYFYHAGAGIYARPMSSPTSLDTSVGDTYAGVIIDDGAGTWTEGPMVVYHDGVYYLTYTGNHFMHTAYRIEYAISHDDPMKFDHDDSTQLFVSTTSEAAGIGHSSTVKGPDLDSYYLVYHTRNGNRWNNIDRIVFNGDRMTILGPTVARAAVPSMPDIYALFDSADDSAKLDGTFTIGGGNLSLSANAKVMAKDDLARDQYTIEITTKNIKKDARAGVIFGYKDDNNYGSALFDTKTEELVITFVVNGTSAEYREKLVRSFDMAYDFNAVQAIQVEKTGNTFTFYVNDRELCKKERELSGLGVGMMTEGGSAEFGYFGATAEAGGNSTKEYYKPVATQTGYILSTHCREWDIKTGVREDTKEVYLKAETGRTYNYAVFAEKPASYSLATCYRSEKGATLAIFVNGVYERSVELRAGAGIATEIIRGIKLGAKGQIISVYVIEGEADIFYYRCQVTATTSVSASFDEGDEGRVTYSDGTKWSIKDGKLSVSGFCKRLFGSYMLGDYTVRVDVEASATSKFGLIVRATSPGEPTYASAGNVVPTTDSAAQKGINWMQGYYVQFDKSSVKIFKISYNKSTADAKVAEFEKGVPSGESKIAVKCIGATLTVYINGEEIGSYTDPEPYAFGMAGIRNNAATKTTFDNFEIIVH